MFMKKLLIFLLILSMLLPSCASTSKKNNVTSDSTDDNITNTTNSITTPEETTVITTEDLPYVPDPSSPHAELFYDPPVDYRWHTLRHGAANTYKTTVKRTMEKILKKYFNEGEGGVVTNVPFDNGFVDNMEHFTNLNGAVKMYLDQGLKVWLYDEQGYPSGTAGGRVTVNNPEYVAQGLTLIKKEGNGKNPIIVNKDERLIRLYTAYAIDDSGNVHDVKVNDNAVSFEGVSGDWTLYIYALKEFYEGTHAEGNGYKGKDWKTRSYLNIMDRDAVASFIEIAYQPYADHFDYLDQVVAIFTDEPSLMMNHNGASNPYAQLAWAPGFEELFEEMHGYSITHKLHFMFGEKTDEAMIVRTNYFQTVAKMVAENFFGQINDFCVEHGTLLGGHMFNEETVNSAPVYGDLMLCYRHMGLPGVDILNLKPERFTNLGGSEAMTVKTAASITRITDKKNVTMVELCALDLTGTSAFNKEEQEVIWNALNLIYFYGGNHINSYVDINAMKTNKQYFVDYFARLGYLSQNAEWDGEIALYNPMATFQAYTMASGSKEQVWPTDMHISNEIAVRLWDQQLDFLRVDDVFLSEAEVKDGVLTNGHASFKAIILPHIEVMPLESLKKLYEFKEAGGKVYFAKSVPHLPDSFEDMEEFKELASKFTYIAYEKLIPTVKNDLSYDLKLKRSSSAVCMSKYTLNGETAFWIYNEGSADKTYKFSYEKDAEGFEIYDPLTGEIEYVEYTEGSEFELRFNKRCAKFVVIKK